MCFSKTNLGVVTNQMLYGRDKYQVSCKSSTYPPGCTLVLLPEVKQNGSLARKGAVMLQNLWQSCRKYWKNIRAHHFRTPLRSCTGT